MPKRREVVQNEYSDSEDPVMSSAEDRLTDILIRKMIDRGLVFSQNQPPKTKKRKTSATITKETTSTSFLTTTSQAVSSSQASHQPLTICTTSASNSMPVFTTSPFNLPPVCTTTSSSFNSINSSVLNLNAAQLFHHPGMGHTTQPSLSLMSNILPQQPVDMYA
ncbi:hypothetical protein SNE40_021815 [Patella caerulea]|uniref:Uncharacterized protein n=1 Tax=Patella caerulea TaxID=87958 RepID=A0AAN8GBU3_PATCE